MEITTTPCHPKANSYYTLTQAESYLSDYSRVDYDSSWNNLDDNQKKLALVLAAKALNSLPYKGQKVCKTQTLAFPRLSGYNLNTENRTRYRDFYWATYSNNLTSLISSGDLEISSNKIYDRSSSADAFYSPWYNGYLVVGQMIKQSGFSNNDTYLTVDHIDPDGEYIEIREDLTDEDGPSSGVDIHATPLFGVEDDIGRAQTEFALQGVNETIYQRTVGEMGDPQPRRIELGGTLMVWYKESLYGQSKFSPDRGSPIDVVYYYLSNWLGVQGRLV